MPAGKRSVGERGAWRPDARITLGIAGLAALVVTAGFIELFASNLSIRFSRPSETLREQLVFTAPRLLPPPRPAPRKPVTVPALTAPSPVPLREQAWPPLMAPVSSPGVFTPQDYVQERAQQNAAALRAKVTGDELGRDLGKVTDMPALRDNQSIPTTAGDKMIRHGDGCAQVHTVQGSPSPTNKIDLAEPMAHCPGVPDPDQDMSRALQDWAEKHRPPPP